MTEQEFLASEDPQALLQWFSFQAGQDGRSPSWLARKLRLLACACCRSSPTLVPVLTAEDWQALEAAEEWAETGSADEVPFARYEGVMWCLRQDAAEAARLWVNYRGSRGSKDDSDVRRREVAALLRDICGNPFRPVTLMERIPSRWPGSEYQLPPPWLTPLVLSLAEAAYAERGQKCGRCGGCGWDSIPERAPARPNCPDCHGTGTQDGTLDNFRLALVAEALEEAGCGEVECGRGCEGTYDAFMRGCLCGGTGRLPHPLLAHLRSQGPHYPGCYVVDLLLRKE